MSVKLWPWLVVLLCAGPALARENPGTRAGWDAVKEGDFPRAERIFEQVLSEDPNDMKAWEGYRLAFQKRKKQEDGESDDSSTASAQPAPRTAARPPARKPTRPAAADEADDAAATSADPAAETDSGESTERARPPRRQAPRPDPEITDAPAAATEEPGDSEGSDSASSAVKPRSSGGESIGRIDPKATRNAKKARERFEKIRDELSEHYRRISNGVTELHVTHYNKRLYKALVERLAAEKGYTIDKAQKLYEATVRDMKGQLEFYVKLNNYSKKPKVSVSIADIVQKTQLVDDEGNAYEPARFKAPKGSDLVGEDAYTVWFSRTDADGNDILEKAGKGNLYLTVTGMPHEQKQIYISFSAKRIKHEGEGKSSSGGGMMEKVKGWFN